MFRKRVAWLIAMLTAIYCIGLPVHKERIDMLDELAQKIASGHNTSHMCGGRLFGKGWGGHSLCTNFVPRHPCYFYSFGISSDYSFDVAVAEYFGCYGFAADPTVSHNSRIHANVTFHDMAAKLLSDKDNMRWMFTTSIPALRRLFKHDYVSVLKMDCEGCEYSLAEDVHTDDPDFFNHIGQFTVEVHFSRKWCRSVRELNSFAKLLEMLQHAGLKLVEATVTTCAPEDQATGVLPELASRKGLRLDEGHCHNYLFARIP